MIGKSRTIGEARLLFTISRTFSRRCAETRPRKRSCLAASLSLVALRRSFLVITVPFLGWKPHGSLGYFTRLILLKTCLSVVKHFVMAHYMTDSPLVLASGIGLLLAGSSGEGFASQERASAFRYLLIPYLSRLVNSICLIFSTVGRMDVLPSFSLVTSLVSVHGMYWLGHDMFYVCSCYVLMARGS